MRSSIAHSLGLYLRYVEHANELVDPHNAGIWGISIFLTQQTTAAEDRMPKAWASLPLQLTRILLSFVSHTIANTYLCYSDIANIL
ncbi:hypothetical protein ACJX0J_011744, partial [Zea mays]